VTTETESGGPPRPEFLALGSFYKQEIEPWLESQEGRRRKARLLRWLIIGGGLAALSGGLSYIVRNEWDDIWLFVVFVLAVVTVIVGNIPISMLQTDVKKYVMEKLAAFFGFTYEVAPTFAPFHLFDELSLLPSHNNAKFEDGIKGRIKDVPFEMVEAHLTRRQRSGKSTRNVTVFRGLLLVLPHAASGDGAVSARHRDTGFGEAASRWIQATVDRWTGAKDWSEVVVGDTAFDEAYVVRSDSAATARRLLDRDIRRAYMALDRRPEVKEARLGIADGRLLIAFDVGSDSFEAGKMNRPLADPSRVQAMVELFAIPFEAVDGFAPPASAEAGAPAPG
jgi:hypothetical protein